MENFISCLTMEEEWVHFPFKLSVGLLFCCNVSQFQRRECLLINFIKIIFLEGLN